MLDLLKAAPFPDKAPIDTEPWKLGIDYNYLKNLKTHFETKWSWVSLEKRIAHYNNYIVHYENCGDSLDLHYVYARSVRSDAIPLLLLHGWPGMYIFLVSILLPTLHRGTFFDFHKVVEPLINPPNAKLPASVKLRFQKYIRAYGFLAGSMLSFHLFQGFFSRLFQDATASASSTSPRCIIAS